MRSVSAKLSGRVRELRVIDNGKASESISYTLDESARSLAVAAVYGCIELVST